MKYICLQENDYDCGLACMKMMLAHYHKNKKLLDLDKEIVNQRYNLNQLRNYGIKNGLETDGVHFSEKDLLFDYPNSMCHIKQHDEQHFIIFEKKKGSSIYLIDPRIGRIKLDIEYFLSIFTGFALIVKETKPIDFKLEKNKVNHLNYLLVYIIFLILDFGLLFLISYLGNDSKYLFHSLLLILSLILSLICKLKLVIRHQNTIDNNIKKILNTEINLFTSTKRGLLAYKVFTIKYLYGLINCIFVVFFVTFILIVNGLYNILIVLGLFGISFIFSKLTLINDTTNRYMITITEKEFLSKNDVKIYDNLTNLSKRIQKSGSLNMICYQVILMIGIVLLNNITQINSFEFVVFNSFYYLILLSKFNYLLKDNICIRLEYRKYASTYNYLLKKVDVNLNFNENK